MTPYKPPLDDIRFAMTKVARLDQVARLPGLEAASAELVAQVIEEAGRLAGKVLAPLNQQGDEVGAVLERGAVRTAPGFKEAYRAFADGGWMGLPFPEASGGQGLPRLVNTAVAEMWNAANTSLTLCPLLTQAAIEALIHHGTAELQSVYLTKLMSGEWTGAMCLTEPHAGSDVGALTTQAEPAEHHYLIRGQKIFITFGEHDLTPNIVHLVLARLPDAPPGTKGISLFLVPKMLPKADGSPGRRNDVRCLKLEHKLGIKGSPTCVMAYGDQGGAVGFLVGDENAGMRCMFTMMNNARLAVGHEGLGLAERAYQQALAYAHERTQGRHAGRPARLVDYADVRRMLMTMRCLIAAMRALAYETAAWVDRAEHQPIDEARRLAAGRVALLTPVVKAWCTDLAQEITSLAIQVHGGMGYIEETGVAQHYRDARILPIYEGTNGVQAMDLVGRKLSLDGGDLPWRLLAELKAELSALDPEVRPHLERALSTLASATRHLQQAGEEDRGAAATPYLRLFGFTMGGFLLARGASAAAGDPAGAAWPGLARFYVRQLLPQAVALGAACEAPAGDLDPALLAG